MVAHEQFVVDAALGNRFGDTHPAAAVEHLVNAAAGPRPRAQWFRRRADGGGTALEDLGVETALAGRPLPARAFPEQQLRSHWPDQFDQALVRAYLDWQAPWLLMLSHISDRTRAMLERSAARRALLPAENHTLLPKVIDKQCIVAARVEAQLRAAAGEKNNYAAIP